MSQHEIIHPVVNTSFGEESTCFDDLFSLADILVVLAVPLEYEAEHEGIDCGQNGRQLPGTPHGYG